MSRSIHHLIAGACLALFSCIASAEQAPPPLGEIRAQQMQLRSEVMAGSGAFKEMSKSQRDELVTKQTELLDLIGNRQSLADLNETELTRAFNSLEWIKARITQAEDEQVICERKRPVGTNRVMRVCATVGERRKERESVENGLMSRPICDGSATCRSN